MIGEFMLWWHGDCRGPLEEKINKAVEYYQDKYGSTPKCVEVSPQELRRRFSRHNDVVIRKNVLVVPGYLFVGMDEK